MLEAKNVEGKHARFWNAPTPMDEEVKRCLTGEVGDRGMKEVGGDIIHASSWANGQRSRLAKYGPPIGAPAGPPSR